MLLVYTSRTANLDRFVNKLALTNVIKLPNDGNLSIDQPFWLLTYTDQLGQIPQHVQQFLRVNHAYLQAVSASGNMNFGDNFAKAADLISQQYHVPIILKFELSGTRADVQFFKNAFLNAGGY